MGSSSITLGRLFHDDGLPVHCGGIASDIRATFSCRIGTSICHFMDTPRQPSRSAGSGCIHLSLRLHILHYLGKSRIFLQHLSSNPNMIRAPHHGRIRQKYFRLKFVPRPSRLLPPRIGGGIVHLRSLSHHFSGISTGGSTCCLHPSTVSLSSTCS